MLTPARLVTKPIWYIWLMHCGALHIAYIQLCNVWLRKEEKRNVLTLWWSWSAIARALGSWQSIQLTTESSNMHSDRKSLASLLACLYSNDGSQYAIGCTAARATRRNSIPWSFTKTSHEGPKPIPTPHPFPFLGFEAFNKQQRVTLLILGKVLLI